MKNNYFKQLACFLIGLIGISVTAQITLPYSNTFDDPATVTGWTHYALSGTDDWVLTNTFGTDPGSWKTGYNSNSIGERALQTPSIDFTGATSDYLITFKHKAQAPGATYKLQYSTDNGTTWVLLNDAAAQKYNWQITSGFSTNNPSGIISTINAGFLSGLSNVKLRFLANDTQDGSIGWVIQELYIGPNNTNIFPVGINPIITSENCLTFNVSIGLSVFNPYNQSYNISTKYYLSADNVFNEASDTFLYNKTSSITQSTSNWSQNVTLPAGTAPGNYYIIVVTDATNTMPENNETDNTAVVPITVKAVKNLPYNQDFEDASDTDPWYAYVYPNSTEPLLWELGKATRHHMTGTHSGDNCWHTSKSFELGETEIFNPQWLESPYFDLTSIEGPIVMSFWTMGDSPCTIEYKSGCSGNWTELEEVTVIDMDEWVYRTISLDGLEGENNIKFRIAHSPQFIFYLAEGVAIDDIYIGPAKSDLVMMGVSRERFTVTSNPEMTLSYYLSNGGPAAAPETVTQFYWSNDAILDNSDILLGSKPETDPDAYPATFTFTKPVTAEGHYYIIYQLDSDNNADEIWDGNYNIGAFALSQRTPVTYPYTADFESEDTRWEHNMSLNHDDWAWTTGDGTIEGTPFSGTKAWIARNSEGLFTTNSRSHLYTPVFNLNGAEHPVMEFDMRYLAVNTNSDGAMNMSYSFDGGATWYVLNRSSLPGQYSFNLWYYPKQYDRNTGLDVEYTEPANLIYDGEQVTFSSFWWYAGRDCTRNTHFAMDLTQLEGWQADLSEIRFRFNLGTLRIPEDGVWPSAEHLALIDNFSITERTTDLAVTYTKELQISNLSQKIKFFMNIDNLGNYISTPTTAKFYLSADNAYDAADFYLGETAIAAIQPDNRAYINEDFTAPAILANYQYLIYKLDDANTITETNETNNTGAWPLALDGITSYPYINDFNDDAVNGWHQYALKGAFPGNQKEMNYRMRNKLAPAEQYMGFNTQDDPVNGEWATDYVGSSVSYAPTYYLMSPSFNFSNTSEPLVLAFNFACTGSGISSGGNMDYSTDGGNTWTLMTANLGAHENWYNALQLNLLNQPGWTGLDIAYKQALFSLSFLQGQTDVVFRFKYHNKFYGSTDLAMGLRLQDFRIGTAQDLNVTLDATEYKQMLFSVYPNPAKEMVTIQANEPISQVGIYSLTGQKVYENKPDTAETNINLSHLAKGMYLVKVTSGNKTQTEKIIVE